MGIKIKKKQASKPVSVADLNVRELYIYDTTGKAVYLDTIPGGVRFFAKVLSSIGKVEVLEADNFGVATLKTDLSVFEIIQLARVFAVDDFAEVVRRY